MIFINSLSHYVPTSKVDNCYFKSINGLSDEWIEQRTGIKSRVKADPAETTNSMAVYAVENMRQKMSFPIEEVDLIVGASYSPVDTVFTLAHAVQRAFHIPNAQAVYISAACSSIVNALEIVQGYFAMGKASKAIVVASEHNWAYNDPTNPDCGHLWGDGSVAACITKEKLNEDDHAIIDIFTQGLGHIGKAENSVNLKPGIDGISMKNGRDVFIHACHYMQVSLDTILKRNNLTVNDLTYLSSHQANIRILNKVAENMKIETPKLLSNIEDHGNTGCPSNLIVISQNITKFKKGDLIGASVFGGGYSCGAYLVEW